MSRSFGATLRMMAREAARAERARQQARVRDEAARNRALKDAARQANADAKLAAREYAASRLDEAADMSRALQERENAIETVLTAALGRNPSIDILSVRPES